MTDEATVVDDIMIGGRQVAGAPVIIENQWNFTDNDHLSCLLIYAAEKDAKLIIRVSGGIEEEHRQVLDLLSQHTDAYVQFFGVVVELWKIGKILRST